MDLIIAVCRALANRPRLRLLCAIHERPGVAVQSVAEMAHLPLPSASKHLRLLRNLQLIQMTPSGRFVRCTPARPGSTQHPFLGDMQTLVGELLEAGRLNRTLAQVCDSVPDKTPDWETAFDALFKHVTTYTHLRRLLILRCLAKEETCAAERIRSVVGMSADATRRQLDKLQRRGIIARLPTAGDKWALVRTAQPACRRRLLAIVLRALRAA